MSRKCTVCLHPQLSAINLALASGASLRDVAGRFGVSRTAVHNHTQAHLRPALATPATDPATAAIQEHVEAQRVTRIAENASVRDHVTLDLARIETRILAAEEAGATGQILALMRVKYLILNRTGMVSDTEKPLTQGAGDGMDPAERKARAFERATDEIFAIIKGLEPKSAPLCLTNIPFEPDPEEPDH